MTAKQKNTLLAALAEFEMIKRPFMLNDSPLYASTMVHWAKALRLLGRTPEALAKLREGIAFKPKSDVLYLYYAQILLELGARKQAKQVLEQGYKRSNGSKRIGKMLSGFR